MTTLENADYFSSYIKPYATDICVAALLGLGYFVYKSYISQDEKNLEQVKDAKTNGKVVNKWENCNLQRFNYLINSNQDKSVDAFFILDKLQKNRVAPDIVTYNCLLDMSFRLGQTLQANKLYEEINDFTSPVQPEIITFNIILKGCVREIKDNTENQEANEKIFEKLNSYVKDIKQKNMSLNDISYNTLIDAYAEGGKIEKSWELFDEMRANQCKPDLYTYATLIKGIKALPYSEENFKKALEIFNLVKSGNCEGLKVDDFLYNSILDVCLKYNELELMEKLFQEMKLEILPPTIVSYSIMIKGYGNNQELDKALNMFNELRANNLKPNDIIYGCLLNCCVICSDQKLMTEIYQDMRKDGITPNLFIYTTLIKGYNKMKQYDLAFAVFEKMKEEDFVKPNIVIYNAIIDNCVESKNFDKMFEIYTYLKNNESFVQPNIITYSTLIKGFCRSGNMKKAQDIYTFLIENNIKLDDVVFNQLCDGYARLKDADNALKVFEEMKKFNIKRTAVIYTTLMKMFSTMGDEAKVNETFSLLKKEGIKPNLVIYSSMVQIFNRYKKTDEVLNIYKIVKNDKSYKIDYLFYTFVINGCCFNKRLENAIEILMESINDGVKLDEGVYNNVLEYLLANKFMKTQERIKNCTLICKALKDKNYQINIDLYNRLMKLIYKPSDSNSKKEFVCKNVKK